MESEQTLKRLSMMPTKLNLKLIHPTMNQILCERMIEKVLPSVVLVRLGSRRRTLDGIGGGDEEG